MLGQLLRITQQLPLQGTVFLGIASAPAIGLTVTSSTRTRISGEEPTIWKSPTSRKYRYGGPPDLRSHKAITNGATANAPTEKGAFLSRKALEAYFTVLIEILWSKRRILEIYLNIAEFGQGVYGIESASRAFFHKGPSDLTLREAALIAAVLPSPVRYSVRKPSTYLLRRVDWIIMQMRRLGGAEYLRGL